MSSFTHVKIANEPSLIRDVSSKAILNTNKSELQDYLMKRELAKKQQAEQNSNNLRLDKLEADMSEIKSLLRKLAQVENT